MVAFPIKGLKISTDSNNVITVSMTDNPNAESSGFKYYAHSRGSSKKEKFYLGAYEGYVSDNKLRSLSGVSPIGSISKIETARTYARNNSPASDGNGGSGYDEIAFYPAIFVQSAYLLKYKNLNSQATVGMGIISGGKQNTGGTDDKGLNYGDTSNNDTYMKLFGMENLWGCLWNHVDGTNQNSNAEIYTATQGFNNNSTGYTKVFTVPNTDIGYFTKVSASSEYGFVSVEYNGSETTYWCDTQQHTKNNCTPIWGSSFFDGQGGGIFAMRFEIRHTGENIWLGNCGGRLMYL